MFGTPGEPLLTEEWQIALATTVIVTIAWGLLRLARRILARIRLRSRNPDRD